MKDTASIPRYNIAMLLERQGRVDEAIDALRAAVQTDPNPLSRMHLALLLERRGLDDEATDQLRQLILESPRLAEAYNNLAALLVRRGELAEARRLLSTALELAPGYEDARGNLQQLDGALPPSGEYGGPPLGFKSTGLPGGPSGGLPAR